MAARSPFPEERLVTPRLVLRAFEADDVADVAAACADELTQQWLPLPRPYTVDDARGWCTETTPALRVCGDGVHWALVERATGRLVGGFGLKRTQWAALVTEVGYWVAPWGRGRGYATEAVREIGRWTLGEQGFERLELRAAMGNVASQRVAEKAGFTREGVLRSGGYVHGGRVDLVMYSLVRGGA
jgi:RimJ/RimL family protein N-acetyltransferase